MKHVIGIFKNVLHDMTCYALLLIRKWLILYRSNFIHNIGNSQIVHTINILNVIDDHSVYANVFVLVLKTWGQWNFELTLEESKATNNSFTFPNQNFFQIKQNKITMVVFFITKDRHV